MFINDEAKIANRVRSLCFGQLVTESYEQEFCLGGVESYNILVVRSGYTGNVVVLRVACTK